MRVNGHVRINGRNSQASPLLVVIIVAGIFLFTGALFAIVGTISTTQDAKLKKNCTVSVQADVKEFRYNSDGLVSPVYEYEYNGKVYSFCNNSYSDKPVYNVGERAELMLDPDQPDKAYVPKDKTARIVSTIFSIVGYAMIGVAVIICVVFFAAIRSTHNAERQKSEPWEM